MAARQFTRRSTSVRIKPLVLALAGIFPMGAAVAAGPDLRLPTQHGNFTPTQSGTVTVKYTTTDTAARLDVTQSAQRAISQWSSFNVGSSAAVNFYMPNASSAMLARVLPTNVAPQQILGSIKTLYIDGAGKERVGGELFLINAGGWLFGRGATVNVGGMLAGTLDIRNSDFLNGLGSIDKNEATFSWKYAGGVDNADKDGKYAVALYQADGLVQVDKGATITTESGGRVFLFAPKVVNEGSLSTPDGQTVLAGGGEVFLNNPQREKLYASEVNDKVPALRGLLVEVNNGASGEKGSVTNLGDITSARGNTTLVAMAVRQSGRINATTASTANGSVLLAARSGVVAKYEDVNNPAGTLTKHATQGGTLVLGAGSRIEIAADETVAPSTLGTPFTTSRVELSGKTIDMLDKAAIVAPGAIVRARAEVTPKYMGVATDSTLNDKAKYGQSTVFGSADPVVEKGARISIANGAVIDVSGTTTAQIDAAKRNYINPSLVTNSDLKDAPVQKLGPIFHKEDAVFDARQSAPMFSSTQGYKDAATVTATERLSAGGSVDLRSTGAVITHADSVINVSGGQVNFSSVGLNPNAAPVLLTQVKDASGNVFTLNTAPADRVYTLAPSLRVQEAAYVQGSAAGSLTVTGNQIVMPGQLKADTVTGSRQLAGLDPLATRARVTVNAWVNANDRTAADVQAAVAKLNMQIGKQASGASADVWTQIAAGNDDAAMAALPSGSVLGLSLINSQAGNVSVQTDGGLRWLKGNNVTFVPGANLSVKANGDQGLQMESSVRNASGTVTLQAADLQDDNKNVLLHTKGLSLADGQQIDVSGRFVNRVLDGPLVAPQGTKGGTITVSSDSGLSLGQGSVLDVSGGAVWSQGSTLQGAAAGTLTLASNVNAGLPGAVAGTTSLLGDLRGFGLTQGGALSLTASKVRIGTQASGDADELLLTPDYFASKGFGSFAVNGVAGMTVAANTQVNPRQQNWLATSALSRAASDTALRQLVRVYDQGDHLRSATPLTLSSSRGAVVVGEGAVITTDEQAKVKLQAQTGINVEGSIVNHGGSVEMTLNTLDDSLSADRKNEGVIWLGAKSSIDVSGISVRTPGTGALVQGKVLDGGVVTLDAGQSTTSVGGVVVIAKDASIDLRGSKDTFDTRIATAAGNVTRKVETGSAAGTLNVSAAHGAVLEGGVQAQGGTANAVAGKLNVTIAANNLDTDADPAKSALLPGVYRITLQKDASQLSSGLGFDQRQNLVQQDAVWGNATLSSAWLNKAGFADVKLVTGDRIEAAQTATIAAQRSLTLSARALYAGMDQALTLAAPHVSVGTEFSANKDAGQNADAAATSGQGVFTVKAAHVDLNNKLALQGLKQFNVEGLADGDKSAANAVALRSTDGSAAQLDGQADIRISAAQVFPESDVSYTINAPGRTVSFVNGDASVGKPMSAGGQLTVNAATINQGGVLRAPFGRLSLNASEINLKAGSETSVSGAGILVPFGSTVNGATWSYADASDTRTALLDKQITLNTGATGKLTVDSTASVDTRGGGDVYAREFTAGPGGSKDIFAGAAAGAFAVVPYDFANQSGYAVSDRAILNATDASGAKASITPGQQITFGANGVLPAGTYVVLPAAYASMPGAFLVKADTAKARSGAADFSAPVYKLDDGSSSVVGKVSYAGTPYQDTLGTRFVVMNNATSGSYAQVTLTSGNAFFAAQAAKSQVASPALPKDGGSVRIITSVLNQLGQGVLKMGGDALTAGSTGGTLELGVKRLHIGDQAGSDATVSEVSASALNATGAQTLILGGTLADGSNANGERTIQVTATDVKVDASAKVGSLKAGDVTLVATDSVTVGEQAVIEASGTGSSQAYHVDGDGASVRVSANAKASLTRTPGDKTSGVLTLAKGSQLKASTGGVLLEATQSVVLNDSAKLSAKSLSLGAPQLALGNAPTDTTALRLGSTLLTQLAQVDELTLRSYSSIDFYKPSGASSGPAQQALGVGGSTLKKLTLDAGTLQGHNGVSVRAQAGEVLLANTSGASSTASRTSADTGTLRIEATGNAGDIVLATGASAGSAVQSSAVGVSGFQNTLLNAQRSVVTAGHGGTTGADDTGAGAAGGLNVAGQLGITAASLTAQSGANTKVVASGGVTIASNGQTAVAPSGLGAHLVVQGSTLQHSGVIDLKSGAVTLQATDAGSATSPALNLLDGAKVLVQGVSTTVGNQSVDTLGGVARLVATQGDIALAKGATVNVSAAGAAQGGQLLVQAANGKVDLQGKLLGTTQASAQGASLLIDAQSGVNLDALAANLASATQTGVRNFGQQVAVRSRGTEGLSLSTGQSIQSDNIALVSDAGSVVIKGALNADTAHGGSILVAAGKDLVLDGAKLSAKATSDSANVVYSAGRVDLQSATGTVKVTNQTQIDLSAARAGAVGGVLALRALRTADGTGVNIDPINATLVGMRAVQVEGVKVWNTNDSGQAITTLNASGTGSGALGLSTVLQDAKAFAGNASAIVDKLSGGQADLAGVMSVRSGEEVVATGKLKVSEAWNLAAVDADGARMAGDSAVNLTVRAAGDISLQASVSDGFANTTATGAALAGPAGDIRIVGGADTTSANVMATRLDKTGDVVLGSTATTTPVLVRSTTGTVQVAAARNVDLVAKGAAIYTTGQQVDANGQAGFSNPSYTTPNPASPKRPLTVVPSTTTASAAFNKEGAGMTYVMPTNGVGLFYTGGGNVSVKAGGDVLGTQLNTNVATNGSTTGGTVDTTAPSNWLYTNYVETTQQTSWWSRYDKFTQGVATLGGGNVTVQAGGSVQDLKVAALGSGFQQATTGITKNFGAGTVAVVAGQDILGTTAVNTGSSVSLTAGNNMGPTVRALTSGMASSGVSVLHFNGSNQVNALGSVQLGAVANAVRSSQFLAQLAGNAITADKLSTAYTAVNKLGAQSDLQVQAVAGDVGLAKTDNNPFYNDVTASSQTPKSIVNWTAKDMVVTAPKGSIDLQAAQTQQLPAQGGQLKLIAGQSLTTSALSQRGAADGGSNDTASATPLGIDTSKQRNPVVLVAGQGDLNLGGASFVRPVQAYAGNDIVVSGGVEVQHQQATELSVFEAGRDIRLSVNGVSGAITVRGPGDVLLAAGRDIDLGDGLGVVANGNSSNTALTGKSANISLMAGTRLSALDATQALAEGRVPQLLGGFAYLTQQSADTQMDSVKQALSLLGVSASDFDASVASAKAAFVGTLGASFAGLSSDQRVAAFNGLSADVRGLFIKNYLSAHVLGDVTQKTADAPQDFHLGSLVQKALVALAPEARSGLAAQVAAALQSPYQAQLLTHMAALTGKSGMTVAQAMDAFAALAPARQALFMQQVLYSELRQAGRSAINAASDVQKVADYQRGYDAMAAMFSPQHAQASGDISMPLTKVRNFQGGDINLLAPAGNVNGGLSSGNSTEFGVVALAGGAVNAALQGNYLVNTSRVFTLGGGDLLMWSSEGNVDAGKGARTVSGAPAPVFYLDSNGTLQVDTSAAITGSGIASSRDLDVYAPHGIVDSGDAGLRSAGAASLGGARVTCIGCSFGGSVVGLSSAAPVSAPVAAATALPDNTKAGPAATESDDDKKKKRKKRQIQIDFLGYGVAFANPRHWLPVPSLSDWWTEQASATTSTATGPKALLLSALDNVKRRWN